MKYLLLNLLLISCLYGHSQSNDIEIDRIVSPVDNNEYDSLEKVDIEFVLYNRGPERLESFDSLYISYSISSEKVFLSFDTTISVNIALAPNKLDFYTLRSQYPFSGNSQFSVCAEVTGTRLYPQNFSKSPGACSQFLVGVEEVELKPTKVYYSDGNINFSLNQMVSGTVRIVDITGKLIQSNRFTPSAKHSIPFQTSTKGFYFLKIIDNNGNNAISKFVIN